MAILVATICDHSFFAPEEWGGPDKVLGCGFDCPDCDRPLVMSGYCGLTHTLLAVDMLVWLLAKAAHKDACTCDDREVIVTLNLN